MEKENFHMEKKYFHMGNKNFHMEKENFHMENKNFHMENNYKSVVIKSCNTKIIEHYPFSIDFTAVLP